MLRASVSNGGFMKLKKKRTMTPPKVLLLSFAILIAIGTLLLSLPISVKEGVQNSVLTALFTSTSAVAVTGLSVVDVPNFYSYFGTTVILVLIQLGGLGVMTFSSVIMLLVGKKITYEDRKVLQEGLNRDSMGGIVKYVKRVIYIVMAIEGIGALLLLFSFIKKYSILKAIYFSIFHSVSAFCNAGFGLYSNSLENYKSNPYMLTIISILIVLGGLGFAVINTYIIFFQTRIKKINLTSRVAVRITGWLLFIGTLLFFLLEYRNPATLGNLSLLDKIFNSIFQSVTTRTAGFNSLAIGTLNQETLLVFVVLMFIGASPGSTGGGIKTTTFGVILYYTLGIIRHDSEVRIGNRKISWEILNKALALLVIAILYVSLITLLILILENFSFIEVLFEVVSAFATVGLTTGITTSLGFFSKLLIIFTMYLGRVGPLTLALVIGGNGRRANKIKYPEENISIG